MSSSFPGRLDIFRRLHNQYDELPASHPTRIAAGLYAIQQQLGVDPTNLGAAWPSFASIAAMLEALGRIEVGTFTITVPDSGLWAAGFDVDFAHPERFTDADKLIVLINSPGAPRIEKIGILGTKVVTPPPISSGGNTNHAFPNYSYEKNGKYYRVHFGDIGGHAEATDIRVSGADPIGFTARVSGMLNANEGEWEYVYIAMEAP